MWKASVGHNVAPKLPAGDDDDDAWETDPDFVNDVTEEEQRWGSKTIDGSGRTAAAIEYVGTLQNLFDIINVLKLISSMKKLIEETTTGDAQGKQKLLADGPKASYGYGGKFGVQEDR
jgi:cortactin